MDQKDSFSKQASCLESLIDNSLKHFVDTIWFERQSAFYVDFRIPFCIKD